MKRELLKHIDIEFSLKQLIWLTENTDLQVVFNKGLPYLYLGSMEIQEKK